MEASTNDRQIAKRRFDFWRGAIGHSGNLGLNVRHSSESGYVAVAVLMMIFACLILPLMVMLYFDSLNCQKKSELSEARIEKLLKTLEDKK
jgi:hypothetical protein